MELSGVEGVKWLPDEPTSVAALVLAGSSGRVDSTRAELLARNGVIAESIRWFGGKGQHDGFEVSESIDQIRVAFAARDGSADVNVMVGIKDTLTDSQLFADVAAASAFFERGSVGFSGTHDPNRFDGLALHTNAWRVDPAEVLEAHSSFFSDGSAFPPGSAQLDCALVMRRIPVTWEPLAPLRLPTTALESP